MGEIHVGGHDEDEDETGAILLIDSHGKEVVDPVWTLLDETLKQAGPKPVLVEWDTDVPSWSVLADEAAKAHNVLSALTA